MTTSSLSIGANPRCSSEESSSICCNDWMKRRINNTTDTSATQNAKRPHISLDNAVLDSSCLGSVFPQKEPLKIGLYSDDSSLSSCETENDESETDDSTQSQKRCNSNDVTRTSCSCDQCFVVASASPSTLPQELLSTSSKKNKENNPCISAVPKFNRKPDVDDLCNSGIISLKRKRHSTPRYGRRGSKRTVSIDKSVAVIPIPSRTEYSCQVRERIWSSSEELFANAARNSVEFASEGWNWRQAVEDEEMIVHKPSGELIHPIHLHNALACIKSEEKTDKAGVTDGK